MIYIRMVRIILVYLCLSAFTILPRSACAATFVDALIRSADVICVATPLATSTDEVAVTVPQSLFSESGNDYTAAFRFLTNGYTLKGDTGSQPIRILTFHFTGDVHRSGRDPFEFEQFQTGKQYLVFLKKIGPIPGYRLLRPYLIGASAYLVSQPQSQLVGESLDDKIYSLMLHSLGDSDLNIKKTSLLFLGGLRSVLVDNRESLKNLDKGDLAWKCNFATVNVVPAVKSYLNSNVTDRAFWNGLLGAASQLQIEEVIPLICAEYDDKTPDHDVASYLTEFASHKSVARLAPLLINVHPSIRHYTLIAARRLPDPLYIPYLLDSLSIESMSVEDRFAAVSLLAELTKDGRTPELVDFTTHTDTYINYWVSWSKIHRGDVLELRNVVKRANK